MAYALAGEKNFFTLHYMYDVDDDDDIDWLIDDDDDDWLQRCRTKSIAFLLKLY
jgi:hypothetical protein